MNCHRIVTGYVSVWKEQGGNRQVSDSDILLHRANLRVCYFNYIDFKQAFDNIWQVGLGQHLRMHGDWGQEFSESTTHGRWWTMLVRPNHHSGMDRWNEDRADNSFSFYTWWGSMIEKTRQFWAVQLYKDPLNLTFFFKIGSTSVFTVHTVPV